MSRSGVERDGAIERAAARVETSISPIRGMRCPATAGTMRACASSSNSTGPPRPPDGSHSQYAGHIGRYVAFAGRLELVHALSGTPDALAARAGNADALGSTIRAEHPGERGAGLRRRCHGY